MQWACQVQSCGGVSGSKSASLLTWPGRLMKYPSLSVL